MKNRNRAFGKSIGRSFMALILAALATSSCSSLGVLPWDRDLLAKESMQLNANVLETSYEDKIYFSREASSGGRSYAGGGCGCN